MITSDTAQEILGVIDQFIQSEGPVGTLPGNRVTVFGSSALKGALQVIINKHLVKEEKGEKKDD